jgi:hypothetical protein
MAVLGDAQIAQNVDRLPDQWIKIDRGVRSC